MDRPEIDSQAVEPNGVPYPVDGAWTADNAATKQYDSYKVQAVINWINGHDHSGTGPKVGTPAIYGMNFHYIPELSYRWGYFVVLCVMAVVVLGLYRGFRRSGWL